MKPTVVLISLAAVLILGDPAAAWPIKSEEGLSFWADGVAFPSRGGLTWQDIYWSLSPLDLDGRDSMGQRWACFQTKIVLTDSQGRRVVDQEWRTTAPMPERERAVQRSMEFLDQLSVADLSPGAYRLDFTITDLCSGRRGRIASEIAVPAFAGDRPAVSQIQLCSEIAVDSLPSRFRKGGLRLRPNPSRRFGEATNQSLYYYFEVYDPLAQVRTVDIAYSSARDPQLKIIRRDSIREKTPTMVKYGGLSLEDMEEGYYRIWAQARDSQGRILSTAQANFLVEPQNLQVLPEQRKILQELADLEKEGGEYFDKIELIASQAELAAYAKLSAAGRREFLRQFWKRRDPDPATPKNEALQEHVRRYRQADVDYREHNRPGSQSDRGMAYIRYGPPDEVEKRIVETGTKDVHIWKYSSGQVLMFHDKTGVGRFELVYDKQNPARSDPRYLRLLQSDNVNE